MTPDERKGYLAGLEAANEKLTEALRKNSDRVEVCSVLDAVIARITQLSADVLNGKKI